MKFTQNSGTVDIERPGFVTIIGTGDETSTISITTTSHTWASDEQSNSNVPALFPGQTINIEIEPHEVFQLLSRSEGGCSNATPCPTPTCSDCICCDTPVEFDLTGTTIVTTSGSKPAVFSGTTCSFVPYDKWACDHLEQQMIPLETWGQEYLCGHNYTQHEGEPTIWRILSGANENQISFYPENAHSPVILDKGEFIEFESTSDFKVNSTDRLSIAQFMVGQNYNDVFEDLGNGDPAMSLIIPVEQYRNSYLFPRFAVSIG